MVFVAGIVGTFSRHTFVIEFVIGLLAGIEIFEGCFIN